MSINVDRGIRLVIHVLYEGNEFGAKTIFQYQLEKIHVEDPVERFREIQLEDTKRGLCLLHWYVGIQLALRSKGALVVVGYCLAILYKRVFLDRRFQP